MKNKILKSSLYVIVSILVGITAVSATDLIITTLTPTVAPQKTMKSLSDLYTLVTTGAEPTTPSSVYQAPTGTPELTMTSIENIYNKTKDEIAKLSPEILMTGNTVFGVEGTATSGPAELTWQTDPALNLCWSHNQYEIDNGCSVGSGFTQTPDTLTTLGAVEYCKYLNDAGTALGNTEVNIWHLPSIKEFVSISDYTKYGDALTNVSPAFAPVSNYWSSSENAGFPNSAWNWNTYIGYINFNDKNIQMPVRCAR